MQSYTPVTTNQLLGHNQNPIAKLEIYDGSSWIDMTDLAGENYLISLTCQPSGPQIKAEMKLGKWSAQIMNQNDMFSPFHATSIYSTLIKLGRSIKISLGGIYGGTPYYWKRFTGYLSGINFDDIKQEISISGDDMAKYLADFKLVFPFNYWGKIATFDSVSSSGVSGSEIYTEADAMDIAADANNVTNWSDQNNCTFTSYNDTGGGSTYVGRMLRDFAPGVAYVHNNNVGSILVGVQYHITFKGKKISGTYNPELRFYQTISGVLHLLGSMTISNSGWAALSLNITGIKSGALEARLYWSNGAENDEVRIDQISIKTYDAVWYRYQMPSDCTGPYYVTLGQIAYVQNGDSAVISGTTTYRLGLHYYRPIGIGTAWFAAYQVSAGILVELGRCALTSSDPAWAGFPFTTINNSSLYLRLISVDGAVDDQIKIDRISIRAATVPAGPELYIEADAMDIAADANNVTNWSTVTGGTFGYEADIQLGSNYVGKFVRTGSYIDQVVMGSRDDDGNFDGFLYDPALQLFYFDIGRIVETGTQNLNVYYYTVQTLENVVADILVLAGYYEDQSSALAAMNYVPTGVALERVWFDTGTTAQQAINILCQRVNYRFWFDHNGDPCFMPEPSVSSTVDWAFGKSDVSAHSPYQDVSNIINSVSIEGDEQKPFAGTDDMRDTKWTGNLEDYNSIENNSIYSQAITNQLFQDQQSINDMLQEIITARKDPRWYINLGAVKCNAPLDVGDTISWIKSIGGIDVLFYGIIREMNLTDTMDNDYTIEIGSYIPVI